MSAKVLVVYYSRTGTTATVAEAVAREMGADLEKLAVTEAYRGWRGYVRAGLETLLGRPAAIARNLRDPTGYDLVIIGSPVWNNHISGPVRAYLQTMKGRLRHVAFFVTQGGHMGSRALRDMSRLAAAHELSTLSIRQSTVQNERHYAAVARYTADLRAELDRIPRAPLAEPHTEWHPPMPPAGPTEAPPPAP